ncbi:right-handed parallel beta-helix repeat-containing protein [Actinomadura sp. NBRC 104412]|uniref:right-handed parallel beta-helix repeat-containing protein n=1 Tax=Actinomadura sp. NBRC 104412 TaxID=3032203 RepID=UPI0025570905|nr:right-handed parallel beta-helix repeat-containing protein [Actinomadura sp. NBRC 104412]
MRALTLGTGLAVPLAGPVAAAHAQAAPPAAHAKAGPADDAVRQAALVDQEDQRIMQIRSVLAAIMQSGGAPTAALKQPKVFGSSHGKTLVLPPSVSGHPYTVADLVRIGGKYFRKLPDGSFLLAAHLFVADGAGLVLSNPSGPLHIRMASTASAFSSIVSFGGSVRIEGTARGPVRISSWDVRTRGPDTQVADGRAYIRAVGGELKMKHAQVSHLGFWSGRTGGIALTGTERPANAAKRLTKEQRNQAKRRRLEQNRQRGSGGGGPGDIQIEEPGGTATHVPAADLVTGSIENSVISGDAYGLFVSGSNQTQIKGNRIVNSLVHGVLMHRFAKNATIADTTVTGSRGDGFVLSRATEKVRVTDCVAERNGHNGFTLNGQPLAKGPSASGESLESFGDSSVNGSVARNNGHYGIELLGGERLSVQNSRVIGGDMGIVVRNGATDVQISGNRLEGQVRQGIALRDGVRDARLAGNTVVGARTGIYLRNANASLVGNVVQGATEHGITFRGAADGSTVRNNTLSGSGTSAVSTSGSHGRVRKEGNDTKGWHDTASLWMKVQRYAKPMNLIWAGVFMLVVLTMTRSGGRRGQGRGGRGTHPYALQRPLEQRRVWHLRRGGAGATGAALTQPKRRPEAEGI